MCSIRGRHWKRSQNRYGPHPEQSDSLQVHSPSRIESENCEMPLRSQTSWVPRKKFKMFARLPCKLTSIIKLITTKKPTLLSSKKQVNYMFYSQKPSIKRAKFFLRKFGGLSPFLFKRCYLITITWYAKLAPTGRKCFITCECVSSHPTNRHLTYESRHKNGNPIRKWASNAMICMPKLRIVNTKSQFLTPRKIMQRHPIHSKNPLQTYLSTEKTWSRPGTTQECSRDVFPQTEELCDVTDMYPYMETDVETSSEQPSNSPTIPRSSKSILRQNSKPNCNDNCRW